LHICKQEERTKENEAIGVGERVGEEIREVMNEEEDEVSTTSLVRVSILKSPTPNSQVGGQSFILKMENHDSTLRLPIFHGTGRDDVE
jgi:hypothetical protein